jgi:AraC-like DNA-binding protein
VAYAAARLEEGGSGVGRIAAATGWSHKHFVHEFARWVGVAPKQYGRVQRLQRALRHVGLKAAGSVDWADTAATGGFYDQAHLVNEFRDLTGLTPGALLARRMPYVGYLSVA